MNGRRARATSSGIRPGHVTLERALSKLGIASRTVAREWILAGKVRVDGAIKNNPGFQVVPEKARIEIEGQVVERRGRKVLMLHKPRGVVTTRSDEKGRPTVFSLVDSSEGHLIAAGRLDFATTGLLLLMNDTRLADWLTSPETAIPKTYVVTVRGEVTENELARMRVGIQDEGELLRAEAVELRKASGRESHLTVTLTEGKNREIRRLMAATGHEVTRLKRVAIGGLALGELEPGQYREVSAEELARAFPGAPEARE